MRKRETPKEKPESLTKLVSNLSRLTGIKDEDAKNYLENLQEDVLLASNNSFIRYFLESIREHLGYLKAPTQKNLAELDAIRNLSPEDPNYFQELIAHARATAALIGLNGQKESLEKVRSKFMLIIAEAYLKMGVEIRMMPKEFINILTDDERKKLEPLKQRIIKERLENRLERGALTKKQEAIATAVRLQTAFAKKGLQGIENVLGKKDDEIDEDKLPILIDDISEIARMENPRAFFDSLLGLKKGVLPLKKVDELSLN